MKANSPFVPGEFYHIYNRANSRTDKLFFQERNYRYFLKKWHDYLGDVFAVLSYCFIPNHYHFLIRVKNCDHQVINEKIRRFSISYAQAINKQEDRRGSLFQEHPKHVLVTEEAHLLWLVYYIHNNPVHHHLCEKIEDWKYSSWQALTGTMETKIAREEVLSLFGNKNSFLTFHQQQENYQDIKYCLLDSNLGYHR